MRLIYRCAALLMAVAAAADAQQLPRPNTRVRVTASAVDAHGETGAVAGFRSDTLLLARDFPPDTVRIPLTSIDRLEVSAGTRRPVMRFAGIGLAAGAAIGLLLSTIDSDGPELLSERHQALVGAALGGAAGAVVGGFIGLGTVTDRWRDVPLGSTRGEVRPHPMELAIGVSLRL